MLVFTVEFNGLENHSGHIESNGTVKIDGYDDVFFTDTYKAAKDEFERRKKEIIKDNLLAVTLITWEGKGAIEHECYSSNDL